MLALHRVMYTFLSGIFFFFQKFVCLKKHICPDMRLPGLGQFPQPVARGRLDGRGYSSLLEIMT